MSVSREIVPAATRMTGYHRLHILVHDKRTSVLRGGLRRYQGVPEVAGDEAPLALGERSQYGGRQIFSITGGELQLVAGPLRLRVAYDSADRTAPSGMWVWCEGCGWESTQTRPWHLRQRLLLDCQNHFCVPLH